MTGHDTSPDPWGSCEEDGSCDDSCTPPAREDCTAEVGEPAPPAALPETGADPGLLALVGLATIVAGLRLRRIA